jgi:hypothetical protein
MEQLSILFEGVTIKVAEWTYSFLIIHLRYLTVNKNGILLYAILILYDLQTVSDTFHISIYYDDLLALFDYYYIQQGN